MTHPADMSRGQLQALQRTLMESIAFLQKKVEALQNQIKGVDMVREIVAPDEHT